MADAVSLQTEEELDEIFGKLSDQRKPRETDTSSLDLTDLGNARRLIARFGNRMRYVHPWRSWLCYAHGRWTVDDTGEVMRMAKETVQDIWDEAKAAPGENQMKLASHAHRSRSRSRLEAMVALARTEPGIAVLPADLDASPQLLNVRNGTIDLYTGEFYDHDPADLITKQVAADYHQGAECPHWHAFLNLVLGQNEGLKSFLQRAVGYSLTGNCHEQVFFLLWGSGGNGKTTFVETVHRLLASYATRADFSSFLASRADKSSTDLARLCGARFVSASEAGEGRRFDEARVKSITGGDTIVGRRLYQEAFEFTPQFKLWLFANHKPTVRGTDYAMWRRIILIPFTVTIPEHERDQTFREKLVEEASGILNWAVRGCREWMEYGLQPPPVVTDATAQYRDESDVLGDFLSERCEFSAQFSEESMRLYNAYKAWATERSEDALTLTKFGTLLAEKGIANDRAERGKRKGNTRRFGVRLLGGSEVMPQSDTRGHLEPVSINFPAREPASVGFTKEQPTIPVYREGLQLSLVPPPRGADLDGRPPQELR